MEIGPRAAGVPDRGLAGALQRVGSAGERLRRRLTVAAVPPDGEGDGVALPPPVSR